MRGGHIAAVELLETEWDDEAIKQAKALFKSRAKDKFDGVEVWDQSRFVYSHPPRGADR